MLTRMKSLRVFDEEMDTDGMQTLDCRETNVKAPLMLPLIAALKKLYNEGFYWIGQRVWFSDDAQTWPFVDNYWQTGDLPYAKFMASVLLRFRRESDGMIRCLCFEQDQFCIWQWDPDDPESLEYPVNCFAARAENYGVVIDGTNATDLECCIVPVALESAEYPVLIWESVLTAFGLLLPEQACYFIGSYIIQPLG